MKVPFFDLGRICQEQRDVIREAIHEVLESGWYVLGKACSSFEVEMTASLTPSSPEAATLGCNSGTDALVLPLLAIGVGPGDDVITVSHTAVPTITAIRSTGASPVYAEIDPETWLMDPASAVSRLTSRTRAVVAVHLYGNMADIPALRRALDGAGRSDVAIIEDVAQAQGATWNGRFAGTQDRFGAFSFYPTKNIGALGDGGAVHCAFQTDAEIIRMLRFYGQSGRYQVQIPRGLNSRLDELQAAVLRKRLPMLQNWNKRKERMVHTYRSELKGAPLRFQHVHAPCIPAWHLLVVRAESVNVRDRLQAFLKDQEIETIIHYPVPNHLQPAFRSESHPALSVTENLAGEILSLPMNPGVTEAELSHVIKSVHAFYR